MEETAVNTSAVLVINHPDPDPESAMWLGVIYGTYAIIGVPANLIVLILTITKESVRAVPLNTCIFSLAFADMMVLVSFSSSAFWAITYNDMICKVAGVGIYVFVIMSMMLPSCLAICRHANVSSTQSLSPILRALKTRKGIMVLNGLYWTYGLFFTTPLIFNDKFGLDPMGCCGVTTIDSIPLWIYYMVFVMGPVFFCYGITFIFYGKLASWVKKTSAMMMISAQTRATLNATRDLMRMMKWVLFFPIFVYYPAPTCEYLLRFFPGIISLRTARIIMLAAPLPHMLDPIATVFFVKRYRTALIELLCGSKNAHSSSIYPTGTGRSNVNVPQDLE